MKTFYNALHEAFEKPENKAKFTKANLPLIKIIDLYAGQDFSPQYFEARPLPALFISWDIDYSNEPYSAAIQIRLAYEQLRDSSNISLSKDKALEFFDLADLVDEIIKNVVTDHTGPLSLTHEGQELEPTVVDVYVLDYTCIYRGKEKSRIRENVEGEIEDLEVKKGLFKSFLNT